MNADSIGGYRLRLGPWESPIVQARKADRTWDDDRVIVIFPDMTISNKPYVVSADMPVERAKDLVKALNRAIKLIQPPKPRVKRG